MLHNLWKCLFCLDEFNNFVAFPRRYHRRHDVSCHSDVRQQRLMPIGEGMGTRHIEGVYLTLCSWLSETSQTLDTVNEPSNGRCLRVWLYHGQWGIVPMCILHSKPSCAYVWGLFFCFVSLRWALQNGSQCFLPVFFRDAQGIPAHRCSTSAWFWRWWQVQRSSMSGWRPFAAA